jgi:hypothetical protein
MMEVLLLALVIAAGTWFGGWWAVPVAAAIWAAWRRHPAWRAGVAGAISWSALLALTIPIPALWRLAPRLGGILGLPGWAVLLVPPLFAGMLGWSAARVAGEVRARVNGER